MIVRKYFYIQLILLLSLTNCKKKNDQERALAHTNTTEAKDTVSRTDLLYIQLFGAIEEGQDDLFDKYITDIKQIDSLVLNPKSEDLSLTHISPLGYAAHRGNVYAVRKMIKFGANIEIGSEDDIFAYNALYDAINGGHLEIVKILVELGTDVNQPYAENAITPLSLSCMVNNYEIAKFLIENRAHVDGGGKYTAGDYIIYPLHEAIANQNEELVKLLLEYDADIRLTDKDGKTAIDIMEYHPNEEIMELLKAKQEKLDL